MAHCAWAQRTRHRAQGWYLGVQRTGLPSCNSAGTVTPGVALRKTQTSPSTPALPPICRAPSPWPLPPACRWMQALPQTCPPPWVCCGTTTSAARPWAKPAHTGKTQHRGTEPRAAHGVRPPCCSHWRAATGKTPPPSPPACECSGATPCAPSAPCAQRSSRHGACQAAHCAAVTKRPSACAATREPHSSRLAACPSRRCACATKRPTATAEPAPTRALSKRAPCSPPQRPAWTTPAACRAHGTRTFKLHGRRAQACGCAPYRQGGAHRATTRRALACWCLPTPGRATATCSLSASAPGLGRSPSRRRTTSSPYWRSM